LNTGYVEHTTITKISHLLYLDHLNLLGKTEEEIQKEMQVVRNFSNDIHMDFGLDMCRDCSERRKISLFAKFNTSTEKYKSSNREKRTST
jgi:hypothetical protein